MSRACTDRWRSRNHYALPIVSVASLTLAASLPAWADFTGNVVAVQDGDTITVLDAAKTQHKVRLAGIDETRASIDAERNDNGRHQLFPA